MKKVKLNLNSKFIHSLLYTCLLSATLSGCKARNTRSSSVVLGSGNSTKMGQVTRIGDLIHTDDDEVTLGIPVKANESNGGALFLTSGALFKGDKVKPVYSESGEPIGTTLPNDKYYVNQIRDEQMDAALVSPVEARPVLVGYGSTANDDKAYFNGTAEITKADVNTTVWMIGGKSKFKRGIIESVNANGQVIYHNLNFRFSDHFLVKSVDGSNFAEYGDAGAVVVRESDSKLIGMVRGISLDNKTTACFSLEPVLRKLKVRLVRDAEVAK